VGLSAAFVIVEEFLLRINAESTNDGGGDGFYSASPSLFYPLTA
jgi:hypothetical protein